MKNPALLLLLVVCAGCAREPQEEYSPQPSRRTPESSARPAASPAATTSSANRYSAMTPAQREEAARTMMRDGFKAESFGEILDACTSEEEKRRIGAVVQEEERRTRMPKLAYLAGKTKDGPFEDEHIAGLAKRTDDLLVEHYELLPLVSRAEALKDPTAAKGKRIVVTGRVFSITRTEKLFRGSIWDGNDLVEFMTARPTGSIVQDKHAKLHGMFVSAKHPRLAVVIGAFDLPENREPKK